MTVENKKISIPENIMVKDFANKLELPITVVISELMKNGVSANINEYIDFEVAAIIGENLGFKITKEKQKKLNPVLPKNKNIIKQELKLRPPIVVVMGHVDHGKTQLLDYIRKENVISTESGGITQHIGAYQVEAKSKDQKKRIITFLDTPGHQAFSAMRAHGAKITDIVILVVATDQGVQEQTKEAIKHAQAAKVPIIVALNKIDLPASDVEKTKRQLADEGLSPEEWGGKTIMVPISAKSGKGIDELLEMVLLVTDMENIKANYNCPASGIVIESHLQSGLGPVATIIIQEGILKIGQAIIIGKTWGKIRTMENFKGKKIIKAEPAMPIKISGIEDVPEAGERFIATIHIKEAKATSWNPKSAKKIIGLTEISEDIKEGKIKELKIILKTDVLGSLTAIKNIIDKISNDKLKIKIINEGTSEVNESDVNLALATDSIILSFRATIKPNVHKLAQQKGIKISSYDIIYKLAEDLEAALKGLLVAEKVKEQVGEFEIIKIFRSEKNKGIVGGKVTSGYLLPGLIFEVVHQDKKTGKGKIISLQVEKNKIEKIEAGVECGLAYEANTKIKKGDKLIIYQETSILR